MSDWKAFALSEVSDIRISNVDKKSTAHEPTVLLCNYMDVYANDYIKKDVEFMEATASAVEIEKFKVEQGDVLITKDSETPYDIGISTVVVDEIENLICGYHLALIKPNKSLVDSVFLAKQLATAETASYFSRLAAGSTRYGLSNGAIARTVIRAPSLLCQQKIASILQTIDQAIEQTSALIGKYQQIKAGLMHDLFTCGIGADGKLRPPREQAPDLYQKTSIGWIPKGWKVLSINQLLQQSILLDVQDGNHGGSHPKKADFVPEGIPFIMASDISEGQIDAENCYRISEKQYKGLRIGFSKLGDVLLSHKATIGLVAVVTNDSPEIMLTPQVTYFRLSGLELTSEYLAAFFKSHAFQIPLKSLAQQSTRDYIGITAQKRLHIAYPEQLDEQSKIAQGLYSMENKLRKEKDYLQILRTEKAGLMHDLLTGKVQVTPSPEAVHG